MLSPIRYAVSFIIYNDNSQFLIVKRPKEDKELGDIWGLPAASFLIGDETPEEAVVRGGMEKLNCVIEPFERLPLTMIQERSGYSLMMIDYKCRLIKGKADASKAHTKGTKYTDQKWTSDPKLLMPGAQKGSACIQIFLLALGLLDVSKLKTKLS